MDEKKKEDEHHQKPDIIEQDKGKTFEEILRDIFMSRFTKRL